VGLDRLISNERHRETLGRNASNTAAARWHPALMEARIVDIYRTVIGQTSASPIRPEQDRS
jgi:hypothetical protein